MRGTTLAMGVSWGDRKGRRRAAAAAVTAVALLAPAPAVAGAQHQTVLQQVIVQALPGAFAQAESAVRSSGGKIARDLHLVNGFSASLPAGTRLGSADGILAVTPDRVMHLESATYAPTTDAGAPLALQSEIGATSYYQNGFYGQGVGVALVDSGVVPEDGLHNNVFYGPDFTPQASDPTLRYLDTYGHGTFMAGLIAGRADAAARPYSNAANFTGVAPEANLISLKVADALGDTTESSIVGAVDWATEHRADKGLNIKVLNLSLGAQVGGYANDPLAAAVERAWSFGITVVAAAGNEAKAGLDLPASDPYTIAVGALNDANTTNLADDSVASFSNSGANGRNPDLVAPGTHLVSLRDSGSYVDSTFGSTGVVASNLFRGSGTSEATAITSGAAALVISEHPGITPDQVKGILDGTARSVVGTTAVTAGAGLINLAGAYGAGIPNTTTTATHAAAYGTFASSLWGGSWSGNVWQSGAQTDVLLSGGKLATSSSVDDPSRTPNLAVDGDTTTRWSSAYSDNQWIEIDLGASATIDSVTLQWEAAYGKAFQIQTSNDNSNWTSIYSTTTGTGGTQKLTVSGTGRYVRMLGSARGPVGGYSLWEFQVYGHWTPQTCTTGNAAAGKPATASSYENATVNAASMAFDNDPTTRWSSAFSDSQWLQVDLGSSQPVCLISLSWEAAYATSFELQLSPDATNWTTVYSTTTGTGGLQDIPVAGVGRYVRMLGISRSSAYGYSLWDMAVHTATGATGTVAAEGDGGTVSTTHFNGSVWNGSVWNGSVWNGSVWNGSVWNGSVWNGSVWNGSVWNGKAWN